MKILSIDCGIKNLALCLVDIKSKDDFEIIFWDNINMFPINSELIGLKCSECRRNATFHLGSKGYCKTHSVDKKVREIKERNSKTLSYKDISLAIIKTFNDLNLNYDKVYIEQQPKKNGRMKCLQMMMFHNFMIKDPKKDVIFVSPKYKLRDSTELYKSSSKKTKYQKNKDVSVRKTLELLTNNQKNLIWFNKFKDLKSKKDDYADSFMQAYNYFNHV